MVRARASLRSSETALLAAAGQTLSDLRSSGEVPPPFAGSSNAAAIFAASLDIQVEQCRALALLHSSDLYRPAFPVLRGLLESAARLAWIAGDAEHRARLYAQDAFPSVRTLLDQIGWGSEYEAAYPILSDVTHAAIGAVEIYEEWKIDPLPEVLPLGEVLVFQDEAGVFATARRNRRSARALRAEYGPYVAVKAFDVVLAELGALFGPVAAESEWWPAAAIPDLATLLGRSRPAFGTLLCEPQLALARGS